MNGLFWVNEETNACNFADDTTLYVCDKNLNKVIGKLERDSFRTITWFEDNYMKLNADKCHLLVAGHNHELQWAKIGDEKIWETNEQRLLGINIGKNLSFESHIANICTEANSKLTAIARYSRLFSFKM